MTTGWRPALDVLVRELRDAARALRRSPGTTLLSVATMGIGIGVGAILFTLIDDVVLRPLPYPEPDRLVRIFDVNRQAAVDRAGVATGNLDDWRRRAGAFDGLAGYYAMGRTVSVDGNADALITAQVTRDFFELLRVEPLVGRWFTEDETRRALFNNVAAPVGTDPVVIVSHDVWMQRFGGAADVVGRTLVLERQPFTIVGVMPAGFAMPDARVRLWIPWGITPAHARDQHYLGGIARLKPGVSIARAEAMLNAVAAELAAEHPDSNRGWSVRLSPLAAEVVGDTAGLLWMLFGAVGLVLLVACANVALLSLLRGLDRRDDTAVRLALGASPARLLREFLWEAALLAVAGGLAGVAIAVAGLRLLPGLAPDLPRLHEVAFDARALGFIAAMTALAALVSGLPQAWRRTRIAPLAALSAGTLRATEGADRRWLRDGSVVIQVALAVVLATGAGLLVRSFLLLRGSDPGFDPRGVLVAPVFLDNRAYDSGEKVRTYYRTLFDRLSALPGVEAVGGATSVPTSPLGPDFERPVWPADSASDAARLPASVRMITPGYLQAMSLRVVAGRPIDDRDAPNAPRVLMVSETLARRLWPGTSAVGRRLVVDYSSAGVYPYEVVGVIGDHAFRGPRSEPRAAIYLPHAQRSYLILNVVVKTAGDPRALVAPVRAALKDVDPLMPAQGLYPLEDLIGATYVRDRQAMVVLLVFAAAASFLAVLGVYGVLSQRVRERTREIGIRMAIGADARSVLAWVAGSGLRLIALGLASGTLAARALADVLAHRLFNVAPNDGLTTVVVAAALGCIGAVATLAPSWRAMRVDPVRVLRRG